MKEKTKKKIKDGVAKVGGRVMGWLEFAIERNPDVVLDKLLKLLRKKKFKNGLAVEDIERHCGFTAGETEIAVEHLSGGLFYKANLQKIQFGGRAVVVTVFKISDRGRAEWREMREFEISKMTKRVVLITLVIAAFTFAGVVLQIRIENAQEKLMIQQVKLMGEQLEFMKTNAE